MNLPHGLYYVPRDHTPALVLGQPRELPISDEERSVLDSMLDGVVCSVGVTGPHGDLVGPIGVDLLTASVGVYYVDRTGATWALNAPVRPALYDPERSIARGLVRHAKDVLRQTV